MKIGYARVSTGLQNLDLQEGSLNKFGCEKIFTDHMSGAKSNRPGLEMRLILFVLEIHWLFGDWVD